MDLALSTPLRGSVRSGKSGKVSRSLKPRRSSRPCPTFSDLTVTMKQLQEALERQGVGDVGGRAPGPTGLIHSPGHESQLADLMRSVVYPESEIVFDRTKPDGTPRKLLDVSRLRMLGWAPSIPLADGVRRTYAWYLEHRGAEPSVEFPNLAKLANSGGIRSAAQLG